MTKTIASHSLMLELEMAEDEEVQGLMGSSSTSGNNKPALRSQLAPSSMTRQRRLVGLIIVAGIGLLLLVVPWLSQSGGVSMSRSTTKRKKNNFQCPSQLATSNKNHEDLEANSTYLGPDKQPTFDKRFLETFRNTKFDGWGHTFDEVKARKYEWKAKHFAPYLKNGSSIYESACGLGLNMYLTLEILQETANIGELTVYGNEYVGENAVTANPMLEVLLENQSVGNMLGGVCQGDSTDLSWVAPNQFDLVFTGYISPLWDPLGFGLDSKTNRNRMKRLCKSQDISNTSTTQDGATQSSLESDYWMKAKLLAIAQKRQEEWFSTWVKELVRIAKPGAPVIVEEVAFPYCDILHDYDGVSQEFWKSGSEVYGWDIDPESIEFEYKNDNKRRRYNVFMKKNY